MVVMAVILTSCGSVPGLAGACRAGANESPIPSQPALRTIQLDDRWGGAHGSLCFSEAFVFDGRF